MGHSRSSRGLSKNRGVESDIHKVDETTKFTSYRDAVSLSGTDVGKIIDSVYHHSIAHSEEYTH